MLTNFFKDEKIEYQFKTNGYVKAYNIGIHNVKKILALNKELNIPDDMGRNFNVGLNCKDEDKRLSMREGLVNILEDFFKEFTNNRFIQSATLMDKIPHKYSIVPAHQDWTYTDESEYDSVMCWIALQDVKKDDGALGFVPKSDRIFDYIRYFPFPNNSTPVDKFNLLLMSYFEIIEMKAGEIIFFSNKTVHGSFPNISNNTRKAVALNFGIQGLPLYAYIKKPDKSNKIIKYIVEKDFFHRYNNTYIAYHVQNQIPFDFKNDIISEIEIDFPNYKWDEIQDQLSLLGVHQNVEYLQYLQNNYPNLYSLNETTHIRSPKRNILKRIKSLFYNEKHI